MNTNRPVSINNRVALKVTVHLALVLVGLLMAGVEVAAQSPDQLATKPSVPTRRVETDRTGDLTAGRAPLVAEGAKVSAKSATESPAEDPPPAVVSSTPAKAQFRVDRTPLAGPPDMLTIF